MVGILIGVLFLLLVVVLVAVLAAGGAVGQVCTEHYVLLNTIWKCLVHIHSGGDEDPDPKPLQPAIFKTPPKGEFSENIYIFSIF